MDPEALQKLNYYERLNIAQDASSHDIKKGYRKMALRHHPDRATEADKTKATLCFQHLNEANLTLSDPVKRTTYDRHLAAGGDTPYDPNNSDFVLWSTGEGWRSVGINAMLVVYAVLAISFIFILEGFKLCRIRATPQALHFVKLLTQGSGEQPPRIFSDAVTKLGMSGMLAVLVVLWCASAGPRYLANVDIREDSISWINVGIATRPVVDVMDELELYMRTVVGVMSLWCSIASIRGVHKPGIDDVIKWWDTSLMTAMFTYWYWLGGGSLLSSVIWSFTASTAVSASLPRLAEEDDIDKLMAWVKEQTSSAMLLLLGVSLVWSLQYSYFLRIPAGLYCFLIVAHSKAKVEKEWADIQTQLVLMFLFSWCNAGFILTGVTIMAFMGVVQPNAVPATGSATFAIVALLVLMMGWQVFVMAFSSFFSFFSYN